MLPSLTFKTTLLLHLGTYLLLILIQYVYQFRALFIIALLSLFSLYLTAQANKPITQTPKPILFSHSSPLLTKELEFWQHLHTLQPTHAQVLTNQAILLKELEPQTAQRLLEQAHHLTPNTIAE